VKQRETRAFMNWKHTIKLKHLFTSAEDDASVKKSMNDIADVLEADKIFIYFDTKPFRNLKNSDELITTLERANKLMNRMYDYADDHSIWIE
jgi:hypothetical protein